MKKIVATARKCRYSICGGDQREQMQSDNESGAKAAALQALTRMQIAT